MHLGQVDEGIDAGIEKGIHAAARGFWVVTAGEFSRKESIFFDPIGFGDGKVGHGFWFYFGNETHIFSIISARISTSLGN